MSIKRPRQNVKMIQKLIDQVAFSNFVDVREVLEYGEFNLRNELNELHIVEAVCEVENSVCGRHHIADESQLSSRFDDEHSLQDFFTTCYTFDIPMFNETFNNWTDMLCKNNELHELQYNNYCYVGTHTNLL